jgi:hypothetical protein
MKHRKKSLNVSNYTVLFLGGMSAQWIYLDQSSVLKAKLIAMVQKPFRMEARENKKIS